MDLDRSLLKEFAKVVNDVGDKPEPKQYVHGTVTTGAGNTKCVMLDGSDMLTPISEVVNAEAGDRVLVSVSNHQATVIGNITFPPSARKEQQAIDSANGALEQSNQAMEKANDAQTKANSAITDSSVASALANEAKTESAKAKEDANTAIQNADEAKQLAQASSNKSDETQQLANQVKDSVNAANKDIGKLKSEVKTANDNIAIANTILDTQAGEIATIKETYSTKVETENAKADLTTEISKKVGELQTSVENNFSTKTENVALEQKLQTQITQNANSISSTVTKVEKLESDTTEQQKNIDKALQDAQNANTAAGVAKSKAEKAKTAADTAKKAADDATAKAESATTAANLAEQKVTAADKQLQQAKTDLAEAQENLNNVTSRVDATEQEIADAKQKVETANANVTKALTDVAEAKNDASKANEVALRAQGEATAANNAASDAQTKAANAQQVATNAKQAADKAQSDLAALTNRVTTAETNITQTNEAITAQASKITETSNKIDGIQNDITNNYYSKEQTDAQIKVSADNISQTVTELNKVATSANSKIDNLQIGGRNLLLNSEFKNISNKTPEKWKLWGPALIYGVNDSKNETFLRIVHSGMNYEGYQQRIKLPEKVVENDVLTLSLDGYTLSKATITDIGIHYRNENDNILNQHWVKKTFDKTPRNYQIQFKIPSNATQKTSFVNVMIGFGYYGAQRGFTYKALSDGSEWVRVHYLNVSQNREYFANNDEVMHCVNKDNRFSRMDIIDQFKDSKGKYEFMLTYPSLSTTLYNRWSQESSPNSNTVSGLKKITTAWNNHFGGLRRTGFESTLYDCDTGSTWFAPIGQKHSWTETQDIPAANDTSQTITELWARIDTLDIIPLDEIYIGRPKLEIGNKATDWTPAPEDQEQYVDNKIAASEKTTEESYKALISQTANDISALVQKVQKETDANSTSISEMSTNFKVTADGLSATKSAVQTLIDAVNGTVSKEELQQYIRWNGGDLELGNSVQPFRCKLSNTELAFYQNEDKVAWISNKELYILKAIIAQSIGCGNFMFIDEGDLGFSLI